MARYQRGFITLADLFRAYRKAKVDAFYESSHFHAIAYARYEKSLHSNLKRLLARLSTGVWVNDCPTGTNLLTAPPLEGE